MNINSVSIICLLYFLIVYIEAKFIYTSFPFFNSQYQCIETIVFNMFQVHERITRYTNVSKIIISDISPTFYIYLHIAKLSSNCHLNVFIQYKWWELGKFWAVPGVPRMEYKTVKSLKEKYPIVYWAQHGVNILWKPDYLVYKESMFKVLPLEFYNNFCS